MSSHSSLVTLAAVAATAFVLAAQVLLGSSAAFGGSDEWATSVSPAAPANAPTQIPLSLVPGTTVDIAVPPPKLDEKDEIAALERIQYALSEVGDGKTYVWRRWHGRLSGIVQPTASFKDSVRRRSNRRHFHWYQQCLSRTPRTDHYGLGRGPRGQRQGAGGFGLFR